MKWKQFGITIAGGNGQGSELNQLSFPYGIFIDDNQTIHIADSENHRIVEWKSDATNGQIDVGKNGRGNQMNQLDFPTNVIIDEANNSFIISDWGNKRIMRLPRQNNTNGQIIISNIECWGLAMDKDGSFYVSDCKKNEVRRWKKEDRYGTIVAGGNGEGNNLNQLKFPTFIFVDEDYSLYISDSQNHRVIKWLRDAKKGIIVAGANSKGHGLAQLNYPLGVIVDHLGQIYVADMGNDRVMCWCKGAKQGTIVVGGNGQGKESDQFHYPAGLSFDRQGNLYVVDCWNHRIQKFGIDYNKMNSVN